MGTKARRRLAIIVTGMLLAALTVVNIVPVAADDTFTSTTNDPSSSVTNTTNDPSPSTTSLYGYFSA